MFAAAGIGIGCAKTAQHAAVATLARPAYDAPRSASLQRCRASATLRRARSLACSGPHLATSCVPIPRLLDDHFARVPCTRPLVLSGEELPRTAQLQETLTARCCERVHGGLHDEHQLRLRPHRARERRPSRVSHTETTPAPDFTAPTALTTRMVERNRLRFSAHVSSRNRHEGQEPAEARPTSAWARSGAASRTTLRARTTTTSRGCS